MSVATRIELIDPNIPDKPLARIVVPGEVVKEQLQKEIKIGVTLKIDLGNKTKKKTVTIKIFDEELKKKLEEYINKLEVRLIAITSEEQVRGELKLSDIRSV